ncbi:S-adenosyl-L-methionine-dependent methyltransferase [Glomus cerebriforme]|uniref:S-adenosyl-L-methionine-dependent methyltransferase n=1 Tax=Glomus cerebriforme TaxID=658196 RepID=A0A397SXR6_9GLOM|nr:S-adenosyl-L-methionine-dependent methyltransferase [Glomus cerebriforme]
MGRNQSKFKKAQKAQEQRERQIIPKKLEYQINEGRKFHTIENVKYFLPNDEEENDRLHLQHFMWRYVWQSNYSAPVDDLLKKSGVKVLDMGCGAGSWLFELATEFSLASFTGVDISPVIPLTIKPKNVNFIQGNILDGLPFEDNTFDFVHQRLLVGAFPLNKWQDVTNELVRILKPGGYLELMEVYCGIPPMGPITERLSNAVIELMHQQGQDPNIAGRIKLFMEANGQIENIVQEEKFGSYSKDSGRLSEIGIENHIALYTGFKSKLSKIMDISSENYDKLVKIMAKEMPDYNSRSHTIRVYGRKKFHKN